MKRYCWLPAILLLSGCSWLAAFYKEDAKGNSDAKEVANAVRGLPYGEIAAGVITLGGWFFSEKGRRYHKKKHIELAKKHPPTA